MARNLVRSEGGDLAHYDPDRGLKRVAVAEAAEKYFARAKDIAQLFKAIETKLKEQRKFVLWWDGLGEKRGSGPSKRRDGPGTSLPIAGRNGVPERKVIERWRTRLADVSKFEATVETAKERARRICEFEKGVTDLRGASGTGENEWFTPAEYLEMAREVLGTIDLDPASSDKAQKIVQAVQYFTKADDGLKQEWHGKVWLNPPYAQPLIAQFISKLVGEYTAGRVTEAILLTHNYTDTAWFHEAAAVADCICFTRGRVKFYEPDGAIAAPTQGQAFFYFGQSVEPFVLIFGGVGFVVAPIGC